MATYMVSEINVQDGAAYASEFIPVVREAIKAAGGEFVATGGVAADTEITSFEGDAPQRVVVTKWHDMNALNAWRNSAEYQNAFAIGKKYASFRMYAVEGAAQ